MEAPAVKNSKLLKSKEQSSSHHSSAINIGVVHDRFLIVAPKATRQNDPDIVIQ